MVGAVFHAWGFQQNCPFTQSVSGIAACTVQQAPSVFNMYESVAVLSLTHEKGGSQTEPP